MSTVSLATVLWALIWQTEQIPIWFPLTYTLFQSARTVHKLTCQVNSTANTCPVYFPPCRILPGQTLSWLCIWVSYCFKKKSVLLCDLYTVKKNKQIKKQRNALSGMRQPSHPTPALYSNAFLIAIAVFVLADEEIFSACQHLSYLSLCPALWSARSSTVLLSVRANRYIPLYFKLSVPFCQEMRSPY